MESNMITKKFSDQKKTADGKERAFVDLGELQTLWFNTGSICNLECKNCYIESSPLNTRLEFITVDDIIPFINSTPASTDIGLTGGEPFANPNIIKIAKYILEKGHNLLILTNAYKVIRKFNDELLALAETYIDQMFFRVSLDHHAKDIHDEQRGEGSFEETLKNITWLIDHGFHVSVAGRTLVNELGTNSYEDYCELFERNGVKLGGVKNLIIFPEMDHSKDVPEITTECWEILKKDPTKLMCASERMIVKHKGSDRASIQACTLLAYDNRFNLGENLETSRKRVYLNHHFCAQFCVLGGASCSGNGE